MQNDYQQISCRTYPNLSAGIYISFYMKDEFYNIFNLVIALHHDKENISRPCSALMMYVKLMHYIKYKH